MSNVNKPSTRTTGDTIIGAGLLVIAFGFALFVVLFFADAISTGKGPQIDQTHALLFLLGVSGLLTWGGVHVLRRKR